MSLREAEQSTTSGAAARVTSRVMCRGTRTRGAGEVVDDEPVQGGGEVVNDELVRGEVVDDEWRDEPHDEPRNVPRHPDARRR
jgi:hypothetical protein